ncbi:MAG: sugar kinase [Alphaproteobacteria bacterium]|nr:sugar kinase [Alphaproteobacteria bacterium]
MAKIITMGEIMLRLSPPNHERFMQAKEFDIHYGGAEANTAVTLSQLGHETEFVSAVPNNEIGKSAVAFLKKFGVGTKYIAKTGDRLGIYFCENGSAVRSSQVIYDRANSSIATATEENFDFDEIFKDADWFHFTGITPALSDNTAKLIEKALISAKKHGVTVSIDLNYRKKLWSVEKASVVLKHLFQYVDVCTGIYIDDNGVDSLFGFKQKQPINDNDEYNIAGYKSVFEQMSQQFGFKYCVSTLRTNRSASNNDLLACVYNAQTKEIYKSNRYLISPIIDRIGGGDSLIAAFIGAILNKADYRYALEMGVAASAIKHTIPGDVNYVSYEEINNIIQGNTSGQIQR